MYIEWNQLRQNLVRVRKLEVYNHGHNIPELYHILEKVEFIASKAVVNI